jgi:HEAT repeat protein
VLSDVGKGVNKAAEEQRAREEQNQRMMARSFEAMKAKTFRELENPDPKVHLQAVVAIGQLYSADQQAAPALEKRLEDSDEEVRLAAVLVLRKIQPEQMRARMLRNLEDPIPEVRLESVLLIGQL